MSDQFQPDWDFDYTEMTEEEALAKAAEAYTKCRYLCESDYCMSLCTRQLNDLKLEIDAYFNPVAKNAEDLWFCVQRNGVDFRVLGSQIHDKIQEGDRFAVWRNNQPYQWRWAEFENVWEQQSFWYHVKNLTAELFVYPRDEVPYIWDKATGERVERMLPGGEYVIGGYNEEGHKIRFEGNSGSWDFGEETDTSILTDGRRFFADCPNFNGDVSALSSAKWTTFAEMFLNCTSFNNSSIISWTHNNVFNNFEMYDMFKGATAFNQDLSSWCMHNKNANEVKLTGAQFAKGAPIENVTSKHPRWRCSSSTRTIEVDSEYTV